MGLSLYTRISSVITVSCLSLSLLFLSVIFIYRCTQQGECRGVTVKGSSREDAPGRISHSEFPDQEAAGCGLKSITEHGRYRATAESVLRNPVFCSHPQPGRSMIGSSNLKEDFGTLGLIFAGFKVSLGNATLTALTLGPVRASWAATTEHCRRGGFTDGEGLSAAPELDAGRGDDVSQAPPWLRLPLSPSHQDTCSFGPGAAQ
ncbi:hypothetical protein J0S82_007427 [Galemys pyrenaicus]|uniref:Uncharacterized protein n=1 Tax=Galemys pyrenaicus TaxID=202257 RepID=A0A8J6AF57_GALPY|nr:hypothetical protein J0S82_007427 [Galemys pyrenaicus]